MNKRIQSLDALRILAMFLIVLGHAIVHSGVLEQITEGSFNDYVTRTLLSFLIVHVNCFVLLSGYFSGDRPFSWKHLFKLWGTTVFWSVFLFAISCLLGESKFRITSFIKALTPIVSRRYWFMTTFVLLYLLTPILNAAISAMTKKAYQIAIVTIIGIFIVARNLVVWSDFTGTGQNHVLFFAVLYLTGAYFKKYPIQIKIPWILLYVAISLLTAFSYYILPNLFGMGKSLFFTYDSITVFAASICLFAAFLYLYRYTEQSMHFRLSGLISWFSPLVFGVYLIHDSAELRPIIWLKLFDFSKIAESPFLIFALFGAAIIVFFACCIIEKIRIQITQPLLSVLYKNRIDNAKQLH